MPSFSYFQEHVPLTIFLFLLLHAVPYVCFYQVCRLIANYLGTSHCQETDNVFGIRYLPYYRNPSPHAVTYHNTDCVLGMR